MPKARPKGYRNRTSLNRERQRQYTGVTGDSPKVTIPDPRQHVQGPENQMQPGSFKPVDLQWQIDKVTYINSTYNAALNIQNTLQQTQQSPIDVPGKCELIVGDGNCFFRCMSFLLCGNQDYHVQIRQVLLLHMCTFSVVLGSLLPPNIGMAQYIATSRMSEDQVWATQVEIMAMAHLLKTEIYTYSKYGGRLKWLKHSSQFTDPSLPVCEKRLYLDHSTGNHFNVVLTVGPVKSIEQHTNGNNLLYNELLRQASKRDYHRNYKQSQRSDKDFNLKENQQRTLSRKRLRDDSVEKEKENQQRNRSRKKLKTDSVAKEKENQQRNIRRKRLRTDSVAKEKENQQRNSSRKKLRTDRVAKEKENQQRNSSRKKIRTDRVAKEKENQQRNSSRKKIRTDRVAKEKENQQRNSSRKKIRTDRVAKEKENQQRNSSRKKLRTDRVAKEKENQQRNRSRKKLRFDSVAKEKENQQRNRSRKKLKTDSVAKEKENQQRNRTRRKKRMDQNIKEKETLKRRKWRSPKERKRKEQILKYLSRKKKQLRKVTLEQQVQLYTDLLQRGDSFVCTSCQQTFYQHSVYTVGRQNLIKKGISPQFLDTVLSGYKSMSEAEWICKTCYKYITCSKVPPMSVANGFSMQSLPDHLSVLHPTETEERCTALRIPFMQLKQLGVGKQLGIYGNTVIVPMNPSSVVRVLPRRFEETETIHLHFKRRLQFKSSVLHETVRPKVIYDITKYFVENSALYKEECISIDSEWFENSPQHPDIDFLSTEDSENVNHQHSEKDDLKASETDDDKDTWNELTEQEQNGAGNKDTMLQNVDFTDDGLHALEIAPGEKNHPISLFMDTYAEEKSFPVLFAGGKRPENEDRLVPIKYSTVCKAELRNVDGRFANSVPNIFFKLKKLQALQVKDMATTALRKSKNVSVTAGELKSTVNVQNILQHDEGFRFLKNLRSSPPYYQTKQKELFAMINQLGLPTFFATFSAAETKWTDLLQLLCSKSGRDTQVYPVENLNWMEKCELIQKNPTACARHFHYRSQLFLNNILKSDISPIGRLKDYYIRVEFQQRGSPHLHCLFWTQDAPVYGYQEDKEVIEFIDSHISTSSDVDEDSKQFVQLQVHRHSKSCKKKGKDICRFGFPLPPMKETLILEPFDSQTDKKDLNLHKQDYEKVLKVINSIPKDQDTEFEVFLEKCGLSYDTYIAAVRSSLKKKQILLKRAVKDVRINAHNVNILKIWQANTDLQYVLDPWAVCVYIASYMMKSQRGMSVLLQTAAEEAKKGNVKLKDKIRHISNKFLNHCEVSAQEAIYLLLQLPLTQSSRDVIFVNTSPPEKRVEILKSFAQLQQLPDDSTEVTCAGLIGRYAERPEQLEKLSLAEFAASFEQKPQRKITSKETDNEVQDAMDSNVDSVKPGIEIKLPNGYRIVQRRTPKVIRHVKYNVRKDPELFYREQIMLFYPWRDEIKLMGSSSSYENQFKQIEGDIVKERTRFQSSVDGMEEAMKAVSEDQVDDELDQIAPAARQSEEDAELEKEDQSSILQPPNERSRFYDIGLGSGASSDKQETIIQRRISDEEFSKSSLSLNQEQRTFYYEVLHRTKVDSNPYYFFLSGGAGVGKSHVLKTLYQALVRYFDKVPGENPDDMKVVIAAPTGKAAYNVRGNTLHALFAIPCNQSLGSYIPLDHSTLNTLRCRFNKLKVLIIDEISMVGVNVFNFVCSRLQQIFDSPLPFGGISVIAVGDLYQLRPVRDSWIFQNNDQQYGPLVSNMWQYLFELYELSTIMRQKDDAAFAECLNRIREGKQTEQDTNMLRGKLKNDDSDRSDHIHLFSSNRLVDDHNSKALSRKAGKSYTSVAVDYTVGSIPASSRTSVLTIARNLEPQKTQSLSYELLLKESGNYMVTHNLNTSDGLTNGADCKIMLIQCSHNTPSVVWVMFQLPEIGAETRTENAFLYMASEQIDKSWTPILKAEKQFQVGKTDKVKVVRKQFPLKAAEAMTIHKSQGSTLDKVAVSFKGRIGKHMVYVALSRVQSLEGLCLLDFDSDKIKIDPFVEQEMARLRTNKMLVCTTATLPVSELTVICHNARSLHKNIEHYRKDIRLVNADVIVVQETWAKTADSKDHYKLQDFQDPVCLYTDKEQYRPHAGTFIYVRNGLDIVSSDHMTDQGIEIASVVLSKCDKHYEVISVYCHPPGNTNKICTAVELLHKQNKPSVIVGDMNIDQLQLSKCLTLYQFFENTMNAVPALCKETTDYHSALDHIYTTESNYNTGVLETYWSDHKMIWIALSG